MPHAKIATIQAKYTLEQLHAELGGKILDNKAEAAKLAASMKHVEAVLRLLDPGYNVRGIAVRRRKPNPWFRRGTVFRNAVDVLRTAEKPLSAREIVKAMLAAKGVTDAKPKAIRDLIGSVNASLKNNKGGQVVPSDGWPVLWRLA
ncbi:MAG: hypothetical protein WA792_02510 [Pseudolabrys sp.]